MELNERQLEIVTGSLKNKWGIDKTDYMKWHFDNGFSQSKIAKLFNITQGAVSRILNKKRWGQLSEEISCQT
jgi:predicted XRE-type DNA-binding protein